MKPLYPLSIAFLLAACATTPKDKQADHQRQLWEEARANFLALKEQQHPKAPPARPAPTPNPFLKPQPAIAARTTPAPHANIVVQPKTTPQLHPLAKATPKPTPHFIPTPKLALKPTPKPAPKPTPPQKPIASRPNNDTVYIWQVQSSRATSPRERVAEQKYAHKLAKKPEDLTPEELIWAHEHY